MKGTIFLSVLFFVFSSTLLAQTKYFPIQGASEIPGKKINGTLDDITDFSTCTQVPFTMRRQYQINDGYLFTYFAR
ncbi:MAG: hypothetical protein R2807_00715 [Chitinophagales bacterium]